MTLLLVHCRERDVAEVRTATDLQVYPTDFIYVYFYFVILIVILVVTRIYRKQRSAVFPVYRYLQALVRILRRVRKGFRHVKDTQNIGQAIRVVVTSKVAYANATLGNIEHIKANTNNIESARILFVRIVFSFSCWVGEYVNSPTQLFAILYSTLVDYVEFIRIIAKGYIAIASSHSLQCPPRPGTPNLRY